MPDRSEEVPVVMGRCGDPGMKSLESPFWHLFRKINKAVGRKYESVFAPQSSRSMG